MRIQVLLSAAVLPFAAQAANHDLIVTSVTTVMTGLNAPRGLGFGPDGGLYVAEAGSGFDTSGAPFITIRGLDHHYGETGSVSRLLGGVQERVIAGLPTLRAGVEAAGGPSDVQFIGADAYVSIGMGLDLVDRTGVFTNLGNVLRFTGGSGTGTVFSDVAAHEGANNPNGDDVHSNPFKLGLNVPGTLSYVVDAGANALLSMDSSGVVSTVATFAPQPGVVVPFPIAPQAVPTSLAVAADGTIYVGELGGFPFVPGASRIHVIAPGDTFATVLTNGFTHIIDMAIAPDGTLFVLEFDSNGLGAAGALGSLYAFDPATSQSKRLLDTLVAPTGLTLGLDGTLYISNQGEGDGLGEVLAVALAAVPEPSSIAALIGLAALGFAGMRRRS